MCECVVMQEVDEQMISGLHVMNSLSNVYSLS